MSRAQSPRIEHLSPLLAYFHDYGILICKECQFAIQPKAIDAHLLRHRIYREKRHRLLDATRKLRLLQPHDVQHPDGIPPALPHLPILSGYRCLIRGCRYLCASTKRMSQHFREQHHDTDLSASGVEKGIESVQLQTFFRGNQIRYFRVANGLETSPILSGKWPRRDKVLHNQDEIPSSSKSTTFAESVLQDLMYLHHYTTCVGNTLTRGPEPPSFWTHDLPVHAQEHRFLMHGMLGIAAYHRARHSSNAQLRRLHKEACLRHQSAGLALFLPLVNKPAPPEIRMPLMAFARLLGTQNGVNYFLEDIETSERSDPLTPDLSPLLEFMNMIKGGANLYLDLQDALPSDSVFKASSEVLHGLADLEIPPEALSSSVILCINAFWDKLMVASKDSLGRPPTLVKSCSDVRQLVSLCLEAIEVSNGTKITPQWVTSRIRTGDFPMINIVEQLQGLRIAATRPSSSTREIPCPVLLCYPHIPSPVYDQIASLPALFEAQFPALAITDDLRSFDQAMALLISCYARSYAGDTTGDRWNGIESWPVLLSSHFYDMIQHAQPWALALAAYWCVLLARQESAYWHLEGQSRRLLNNVLASMSTEGQKLVQNGVLKLAELSSVDL